MPDEHQRPSEQEIELGRAILAALSADGCTSCSLSHDERGMIHAMHEAKVAENADHETYIILFRIGGNVKNLTRKFTTSIVWVIVIGAVSAILAAFGHSPISLIKNLFKL